MKYIQRKQVAAIPVVGAVTDTWNVTDKTANAPSLRLIEPLRLPIAVRDINPTYATSSSITTAFGGADKIKAFCQNCYSREKNIVFDDEQSSMIQRVNIDIYTVQETSETRLFKIQFTNYGTLTVLVFSQPLTNTEMDSFDSCSYGTNVNISSIANNIPVAVTSDTIMGLNNYAGQQIYDMNYTDFNNIKPGNYIYYQEQVYLAPELFLILQVKERYSNTLTYKAFTVVDNSTGSYDSLTRIEVYINSNDTTEKVYFSSNSSSEGGLACFTADTPIAVLNGTKLISEIKLDDEVVSYNQETLTLENKKVAAIVCHKVNTIYKIQTENNIIKATGIHPMHTIENGKIFARDVKSGNHLLTKDGKLELVQSIEVISGEEYVYDLGVENNYTYFVGENPVLVYTEDSTKNFI